MWCACDILLCMVCMWYYGESAITSVHTCVLLYTPVYYCTHLYTAVHTCVLLYTPVYSCTGGTCTTVRTCVEQRPDTCGQHTCRCYVVAPCARVASRASVSYPSRPHSARGQARAHLHPRAHLHAALLAICYYHTRTSLHHRLGSA